MFEARAPNKEELALLREFLAVEKGCWHNEDDEDIETIRYLVEGAAIAVFDGHPKGKVISTVWPDGLCEAFVENRNELIRLNPRETT